jgi:hypothetical protein
MRGRGAGEAEEALKEGERERKAEGKREPGFL